MGRSPRPARSTSASPASRSRVANCWLIADGVYDSRAAALVTEPGPVEVYRMQCDNGKVFMARCEMRQCRQL